MTAYFYAGAVFLSLVLGMLVLRRAALGRMRAWAKRTVWEGDDLLVEHLAQVRPWEGLLLALYLSVRSLQIPASAHRFLYVFLVLVLTYRAVRLLQDAAAFAVRRLALPEPGQAQAIAQSTVRNIIYLLNALIWVGALLFALGNLGINITAMLTGLGIGGVAVALAAQAVLSDLFSAMAIFLDRPFVVGDAIAVDSFSGTVEQIGIKTTRVRSVSGELLVFPNSFLASAKIRNFRYLRERRATLSLGISRRTPLEKIRRVGPLVREIVSKAPAARLERVHLNEIAEAAFKFEAVYVVMDPDFNRYMDLQEEIHFALIEGLKKEGISLAYPTQVLLQEPQSA
ncbi:MAG: mechanosensitive ion channel [Elusimicrobia bacterium]|nr:mechanosensitive ion channel [Elusimicrobiota bacterium]